MERRRRGGREEEREEGREGGGEGGRRGGRRVILGNLCQAAHFCPVLCNAQNRMHRSFHIRSVGDITVSIQGALELLQFPYEECWRYYSFHTRSIGATTASI